MANAAYNYSMESAKSVDKSYAHMAGKPQPAHIGSQSQTPEKEDLGSRYGSAGFDNMPESLK